MPEAKIIDIEEEERVEGDEEASTEELVPMFMTVGLGEGGDLVFDPGNMRPEVARLLLKQALLQVDVLEQLNKYAQAFEDEEVSVNAS